MTVLIGITIAVLALGWLLTYTAGRLYDSWRSLALGIGSIGAGLLYLGVAMLLLDGFLILLGAHW